jgi:diacylglycerol O-acyltransferase / wax synthase
MAYSFYEPLSTVDAAFLAVEDTKSHMHIGGVTIFESQPLLRPEGGLDINRIRAFVGAQLHRVPRFRQKLAFVPLSGQPVWVDDPSFNLTYHVRHTGLPFPGDAQKLKDLTGRIMSQQLERAKPLWELWFVEGLEDDRFAIISKIHHALADGISGLDLIAALVGPNPEYREKPAPAWMPRRAPSGWELLSGQARRALSTPAQLLARRDVSQAPAPQSDRLGDLSATVRKAIDAGAAAFEAVTPTPLNVDIGPYRRFDWTRFEIEAIKAIRARFGGKMNDVVLSVVSGAVQKFLIRRGVRVKDLDFRAMVPVSVRTEGERGQLGNRITQMLAQLPIDETDPVRRLHRVIEITTALKSSGQAEGGETVTALTELLGSPLAAMLARLASRRSFGNMIVTNVPGPPIPTYMLGAQTLEAYPLVPLTPTQALNVAVLSYNGVLHWGFNADWDAVPDLADFVALVNGEMEALKAAAQAAPVHLSHATADMPKRRMQRR